MKILVISLAGIGDTLLATPLIHELRANFSNARIDVLTKEAGARDLLNNNPHIQHIHYKNLMRCGKWEALAFLEKLRDEEYDLSVNTHPQSRAVYRATAWMIGARVRVSHFYDRVRLWDRFLCNRNLKQDYSRHSIDNNLDLLSLIGASPKLARHEMEVFLSPSDEAWASDYIARNDWNGKVLLGMHVGSGGTKNLPLKRWPLNHFIELVKKLNQLRPELQILLFGGPEEASAHAKLLEQADPGNTHEVKTPDLRLAAALIRHCHAFLSVDTALMHLAAAMKTSNQMVIEAPTLNVTNWPLGPDCTVIPNPMVNGKGLDFYRYDGGPIKGSREQLIRIMESVTVESVLEKVLQKV